MDFWKYYSGNETDLLLNITKYSHEKEIAMHSPKMAIKYVRENGLLFPEGEAMIAKNGKASFEYAQVTGKRFKLGEPAIAKDPYLAVSYASLINKRFPQGEKVIAEDEHIANEYTHIILKKDFILNGKLICKYEPDDYDYDAEYAPVF